MTQNNKINYIEIPAQNIAATKAFLVTCFAGHLSIMVQNIVVLLGKVLMVVSLNLTWLLLLNT